MSETRLKQLEELLEDSPRDSFLLFAVAKEYENAGNQIKARSHYETILRIDARYLGTYYHLGKLLEIIGESETALKTYQDGLSMAQMLGDQHAYSELMDAFTSLNEN